MNQIDRNCLDPNLLTDFIIDPLFEPDLPSTERDIFEIHKFQTSFPPFFFFFIILRFNHFFGFVPFRNWEWYNYASSKHLRNLDRFRLNYRIYYGITLVQKKKEGWFQTNKNRIFRINFHWNQNFVGMFYQRKVIKVIKYFCDPPYRTFQRNYPSNLSLLFLSNSSPWKLLSI